MYQVIIDNYKNSKNGYDFYEFRTYSEVTCKLKHEINSIYHFVYVRKVLKDMTGKFKLILTTSYTFSHFHKVDSVTESYLCNLWSNNK